jgi:hypothetical protein
MTGERRVPEADFHAMMSRLMSAEKRLPDDFWAVTSIQILAETIAEIEARLSDEELAMLIGVGAVLIRLSREEAMAGIRAGLAIQRARGGSARE